MSYEGLEASNDRDVLKSTLRELRAEDQVDRFFQESHDREVIQNTHMAAKKRKVAKRKAAPKRKAAKRPAKRKAAKRRL